MLTIKVHMSKSIDRSKFGVVGSQLLNSACAQNTCEKMKSEDIQHE